jgi:hypothetical protein
MNRTATPTFLGIGATKAGTTWLHHQLAKHPDIWVPPVKELNFFDRAPHYLSSNALARRDPWARFFGPHTWERRRSRDNAKQVLTLVRAGALREAGWWLNWTFGIYTERWYARLFPRRSFTACGEITPSYSILEAADIARIKAVNPDMKLIYFIRNPIERAWSAVRFRASLGLPKIDLGCDAAVISLVDEPGIVLRGDYERTLGNYLGVFDPSRLLICFYDAIQADPAGLLADITAFLGVPPPDPATIDNRTRVNASPAHAMSPRIRDYLNDRYGAMTERLARRLGSYAETWIDSGMTPAAMTAAGAPIRPAPTLHLSGAQQVS